MAALVTPAASVVSELVVHGRESAAVLEALLQNASTQEHGRIRELTTEILRCCDRALAVLHGRHCVDAIAPASRKRKSGPDGAGAQTRPKRRMHASSGLTATRVGTAEDGFIWRKYGQKEIMHSRHRRLYFRCSYKLDGGCPATRQVQQSEDDPSLYVVTYFGDHTCSQGDAAGAVLEAEDVQMQPFVIDFGSARASSTSGSPWLTSDDGDGRSEISPTSHAVCLSEGEEGDELRLKVIKVETASLDSQPGRPEAAELSTSPDVSYASPAWDPLSSCLEWDQFVESSFDFVGEFINFDDIALYQ